MPENENGQNIGIGGNVDKSAIIDGNQNITNQNIVNINVHLKAILIFLCLAISIAAVVYFRDKFNLEKNPPKFVIQNRILRSDAALIIKAGNESANRRQPLTVEFSPKLSISGDWNRYSMFSDTSADRLKLSCLKNTDSSETLYCLTAR